MNLRFEPVPVYFMHIPKTAGTTVKTWMKRYYRASQRVDIVRPTSEKIRQAQRPSKSYVYSAHFGRPLFNLIGRSDLAVLTVLRDPIERAVSEFYHYQRRQAQQLAAGELQPATQKLLDGPIDAYVADPAFSYIFSNRQTRCLSGMNMSAAMDQFLKENSINQPSEASFSIAARWLQQIPIIGITEEYERTTELISTQLGIPLEGSRSRQLANRGRAPGQTYRERLSPATLEMLETLNREDTELYQLGRELFREQYALLQSQRRRSYSIAAYGRLAVRTWKDRFARRPTQATSR